MDRIIEFVFNHWELVIGFLAALAALIFTEKRKATPTVTPQIATLMSNNKDTLLLDVRPVADFQTGHILNAKNIAYSDLNKQITQLKKHKDTPIIVICKAGQTSVGAANILRKQGFTQVYRMNGGIAEWVNQNLPLVRNEKNKSTPDKAKSRKAGAKGNQTKIAQSKEPKLTTSKPKDHKSGRKKTTTKKPFQSTADEA